MPCTRTGIPLRSIPAGDGHVMLTLRAEDAMDLQVKDGCRNLWSDIIHFYWLASRTGDIGDYSTYTRAIRIYGCMIIEKKLSDYSGCNNVGYFNKEK